MAPELLEDDEDEEAEQTDEQTDEVDADGGENEGDEDEEVAEATLPGDEGVEETEDGDSSGGILSKINTKAVIVVSVVVVGGLILWRAIRGSGSSRKRQGRGNSERVEGNANPAANQSGGEGEALEDQIQAPDSEPLKQDEEMMSMLGMGGQ
jgi:hypothetical protein